MNFELKSHPAKKLITHLKNVGNSSKEIINSKKLNLVIPTKNLSEISYLIGITHDFGKANSKFQEKLKDNNKGDKYSSHSLISSFLSYLIIKEYCLQNNLSEIFS